MFAPTKKLLPPLAPRRHTFLKTTPVLPPCSKAPRATSKSLSLTTQPQYEKPQWLFSFGLWLFPTGPRAQVQLKLSEKLRAGREQSRREEKKEKQEKTEAFEGIQKQRKD